MNKKVVKAVLNNRFIFLLPLFLLLFSCSSSKEYDWTILIYMAADNSLSQNALSDINEMEKAEFSDNIKVIVRVDLLDIGEHLKQDGNTYDISHDDDTSVISSKVVKSSGEIDSGDYHSLINFTNWGFGKYPSRKKALFIWSHGNGWYSTYNKFCFDQKNLDFIDVPKGDLYKAFGKMENSLDILGLDACNMQTLEVDDNIADKAKFIIASEYIIKPDGFPYDDIFNEWQNYDSTENLSQMISEKFYESYMPGGSQNVNADIFPFGVSTFSSKNYITFWNDMTAFLNMDLSGIKDEIIFARNSCYAYLDSDYSSQIDVNEFFYYLNNVVLQNTDYKVSVNKIIDDLENLFPYKNFYLLPDNGDYATVWFPTDYETYQNMFENYNRLSFNQLHWDRIINVYFSDRCE